VGVGGTGSHVLLNLVKILLHAHDIQLPPITVVVIDGDSVERKNTRGRQLFTERDIGYNKAEVLATRFNAAYGLKMSAVPHMATADILRAYAPRPHEIGILIGCVDRPSGRRVLQTALGRQRWHMWVDCGNGRDGGQVCWGTATRKKQLQGSLVLPGHCTAVPGPALQFAELLTLGEEEPVMDCAQRVVLGEQSLLINVQMAAVAALYLSKLIIEREIDYLCSQIALDPPMIQTAMLTETTIAATTRIKPAILRGAPFPTLSRSAHGRSLNRHANRKQGASA